MQHSGVHLSNIYFYLCYIKHNFLYSELCQMKWHNFYCCVLKVHIYQ